MKLRQERALEFVEMIRDNPGSFIQETLETEKFQDGFVYALEYFLRERNSIKRAILKEVFLGFSASVEKETFPLERFNHVTSQLSLEDIATLRDVQRERVPGFYQVYGKDPRRIENIFNLVHLGLLEQDTAARLAPVTAPFVNISDFGIEYAKYIRGN